MTMGADRRRSSTDARVRSATPSDAAACQAVYAPYVEGSVISFEEWAPEVDEVRERIAAALETHAWVVLETTDAGVLGYAYAGPHRSRPAYRWACEVSVYVEQGCRRRGAGRMLYEALFERLAARGFLVALAGMTLPNPASRGLHLAVGFEDVGTWRRIGWKRGAWHDVHWMQRPLADGAEPPAEPT